MLNRSSSAALLCLFTINLLISGCEKLTSNQNLTPTPEGGPTSTLNLAYAFSAATYTNGVAIIPNSLSVSGGLIAAVSITPALPSGLALDPINGQISGTPTVISPSTEYVVTASNAQNHGSVTLTITVNDVAPTGLSYSSASASYSKGIAITATFPAQRVGQ